MKSDKNVKKAFHSRLFLGWFLSYLLILVLPLAFFTAIFGNFVQKANQDIYDSREATLWQFSQIFDQRLKDVENLAVNVSVLSEVNAIKRTGSEITNQDVYKFYLLQQKLKLLRSNQSFIQAIYLYIGQSRTLLSEGYLYQTTESTDTINSEELKLIRDYSKALSDYPSRHYQLDTRTNRFGITSTFLTYIFPVSSETAGSGDAIFIVINTDALQNILTSSLHNADGGFYLVNQDNVLPLNHNITYPASLTYDEITGGGVVRTKTDTGTNMMALSIAASENPTSWSYVYVFESDLIDGSMRTYVFLYIICIVFSLLIGNLLSYYFSKRNYHPVQMLEELFRPEAKRKSAEYESKKDGEIGSIILQIRSLQEFSSQAEARLAKQEIQLKQAILAQALRGEISAEQQESELIANGFVFDDDRFCVLLFDCVDCTESMSDREKYIAQIKEAKMPEGSDFVFIRLSCSRFAVLLIFESQNQLDQKAIHLYVGEIADAFNRKYPRTLFGCSLLHDDLQSLATAYHEAEQTLEYGHSASSGSIFYEEKNFTFHFDQIEELYRIGAIFVSEMRAQNPEASSQALDRLITFCCSPNVSCARFACGYLGNLLIVVMAEAATHTKEESPAWMSLSHQVIDAKNAVQLRSAARQILADIYGSPQSSCNRGDFLIERVKNYIDQHYSDMNLSVTMIADNNDVSASYLAQVFKKKTGHSTADYIHMTRLKNAKLLLKSNRVKDVAAMVGYQDVRSLIRVFKKYEKITPAQFRDDAPEEPAQL
ncbi:MAG: helix-turn-helix domain-containing protein [Acutalibacteraceae bacterium]